MSGRLKKGRRGGIRGPGVPRAAPRKSSSEDTVGSFVLGECFCDVRCRRGHEIRLFNIGRGHFVACDRCRMFMFVGSNLMSGWRSESKDIWRANSKSVEGYEFIEWPHDRHD